MGEGDHPAFAAVIEEMSVHRHLGDHAEAGTEVSLLSDVDGRAVFALGDTTTRKDFPYATFQKRGDDWELVGSGSNCFVLGWVRGRKGNPWTLARSIDSTADHIEVLVQEFGCTSGRTAEGRIDRPTIDWTAEAAVITLTIDPLEGGQTCQGNPPTPFGFDLPGPLGSRKLLDGSFVPPAPPGTPRDPV